MLVVSMSGSPPGSYSQDIPIKLTSRSPPAPPTLPPQLLQVILNTDTPLQVSSSCRRYSFLFWYDNWHCHWRPGIKGAALTVIITRHRASTSMYSLTFYVRVTTLPQYGQNGTALLQITSRMQQTRWFCRWRGESSPACVVHVACGAPGELPLGSATHF